MNRALLPALLTLIAFLLFGGTASAAKLDSPWQGTGPGTLKNVGDGGAADPQFDYDLSAFSGAWTYSTTAATTRSIPVAYDSSGLYSWASVRTKLEAFVSRAGVDVSSTILKQEGPVSCCTAPSNGFSYKGQTTFVVQAGDVYGFRLAGSNSDSSMILRGSLKLSEVDATAPVVAPAVTGTQVAGDYYTGPVAVKWTIADDESRILARTGCDDAAVAADADATLTCKVTSRGGETSQTVTVKRDLEAPAL